MITFAQQDVLLNQQAANKFEAIKLVASHLAATGKVQPEYSNGMLAREEQISTYLDNGVAIPHGTPDTRNYVNNTGVAVVQFPQGVVWGDDGEIAYLAFGIASKNDEHLTILKTITKIIGDEEVATELAKTESVERFVELLQATSTPKVPIQSPDKVSIAQGATTLFQQDCVDAKFLTAVLETPVLVLDNGVLLASATQGCKDNALAVNPVNFSLNNKQVTAVLVASVNNQQAAQEVFGLANAYTGDLEALASVAQQVKFFQVKTLSVSTSQEDTLQTTSQESTLQQNQASASVPETPVVDSAEGVFVIKNEYGLHARPATFLVELVKGYESKVTVQNLTNNSDAVNCKSMIKVIALAATKDTQLKFVATGPDAHQVINAIGEAIVQGLGE